MSARVMMTTSSVSPTESHATEAPAGTLVPTDTENGPRNVAAARWPPRRYGPEGSDLTGDLAVTRGLH